MPVSIAKWGNSLAVRIPREVADRVHLRAGTQVELRAEDGRIIITQVVPRPKLEDLLTGITPEAMREAFDWGPDAGREAVD